MRLPDWLTRSFNADADILPPNLEQKIDDLETTYTVLRTAADELQALAAELSRRSAQNSRYG